MTFYKNLIGGAFLLSWQINCFFLIIVSFLYLYITAISVLYWRWVKFHPKHVYIKISRDFLENYFLSAGSTEIKFIYFIIS